MDTLGFIGTGNMGGAMARRLMEVGYTLVVFDIEPAVLISFRQQGAQIASSPREVADKARIVFTCVNSQKASLSVALGADGVARGSAITTYIESSTIGAPTVQEIATGLLGRGIDVLDIPVSGGPSWVKLGKLTTMAAGPRGAFERVEPVLRNLAQNVFYVGEKPGLAQVCKVVNNALSLTGMMIACEAITMGVKAGLDAQTLIDIVNVSTGRNSATVDKFPKSILPRTFDYGGPLGIGIKDVKLYVETMHAYGMPTHLGAAMVELWQQAINEVGAEQDLTALVKMFENWAGVEVKGRKA
jgi:3-hydroxyisobutyrate dehydrogenase-like beta-hydroxyacid dehydrogenase